MRRARNGSPSVRLAGAGKSAVARDRRRVILRARRGDATNPSRRRAGTRFRRRRRRRRTTDASRRPASGARRQPSPEARRRRTRSRRRSPAPKIAQASVCHAADVHARGGDRAIARLPRRCDGRAARRSPMPVTRTSLPGAAVVATSNRWRARRVREAPRSYACRSTAGRHVDVNTGGTANTASSASAGWIDISSAIVTPRRRIHPHVAEERHVHVVEHEHLVAQHREPVQVLAPFLVRDRRDRGQQRRHVRLERNRHLVAEAPLHADADGLQKPRRGGRDAECQHRQPHARQSPRSAPSPSSLNQNASSASGSAASSTSANDATINPGSWR